MFNVVLGIIAQCCLTILPMYIVLWLKLPLLITIINSCDNCFDIEKNMVE